ncbi:crotonase/enoyl-CoA hydratase family protein [Mesorhizobium australicum]|uniref:Enoyl-CoA hydratase/carnithine racemase n=1 Tax=Mesorhizobium australicum TaxID=536018 RepID=A0A1X7NU92_9HYPH|nr:crotonase/enoyl-CoA hydratase family protein [Mesorhizobium australicum]SMH41279.1 Enoyl-CoA hydratase/carnithine racemase [Mesorhizobium australicum]
MSEHIVVERHGAVQTIRMNRPDKKNAITRAMYGAMAKALTDGDADPAVRCHLILGVPGAFSAGNDMADFMVVAMGGDGGTEVFDFLVALARAAKPIVSAADGIAVGIGTTIHFHCDMTFATPRTMFHTPFVDLGIVPEAGSTLIAPALLGTQASFALLALGEPFSAERAKAAGLIYEVVAEEELESRAMAAATSIAAKPPEALKLSRDLMRGNRDALVERIKEEGRLFTARLKSDETKQALMAFMSRKKG